MFNRLTVTTYRGEDGRLYYRSRDPFVDGQPVGEMADQQTTEAVLVRVWQAISDELHKRGDTDIRAGLGWFKDEDGLAVARAALEAANHQGRPEIDWI